MKRAISLIFFLALIFIGTTVLAASQSYTVAVHIPAIAGFNVPSDDPNAEMRLPTLPQGLEADLRQVVRGNETIMLRTVLVR